MGHLIVCFTDFTVHNLLLSKDKREMELNFIYHITRLNAYDKIFVNKIYENFFNKYKYNNST